MVKGFSSSNSLTMGLSPLSSLTKAHVFCKLPNNGLKPLVYPIAYDVRIFGMRNASMLEKIREASSLIFSSRRTLALTGAGVSTESGIPDFRSPKSLLWERIHAYQFMPMEAYTEGAFDYIDIFYRYWFPLLLPMIHSRPNINHHFLARLERWGALSGVITQNTDGLHQKAGSKKVFEIHGNLKGAHCRECKTVYDIDFVMERINDLEIPPLCRRCSGVVGPDVVFAFERTPDYDRGLKLAGEADLLMVMGSSLMVDHVKEVVIRTLTDDKGNKKRGRLIIINAQPTPFDDVADLVIHERLSRVIGLLREELERYFIG